MPTADIIYKTLNTTYLNIEMLTLYLQENRLYTT